MITMLFMLTLDHASDAVKHLLMIAKLLLVTPKPFLMTLKHLLLTLRQLLMTPKHLLMITKPFLMTLKHLLLTLRQLLMTPKHLLMITKPFLMTLKHFLLTLRQLLMTPKHLLMITKPFLMTLKHFLLTLRQLLMTPKHLLMITKPFLMTPKLFLLTLGRVGHGRHDLFHAVKSGFGCHASSSSRRTGIVSPPAFIQVLVLEPAMLRGEAHPQPPGHLRIMTHLSKLFPMVSKHLPVISKHLPVISKLFLMISKPFLMTLKQVLLPLDHAGDGRRQLGKNAVRLFKALKSGFGCHTSSSSRRTGIVSPPAFIQVLVVQPAMLRGETDPQPPRHSGILTHLVEHFLLILDRGDDMCHQLRQLLAHLFQAVKSFFGCHTSPPSLLHHTSPPPPSAPSAPSAPNPYPPAPST